MNAQAEQAARESVYWIKLESNEHAPNFLMGDVLQVDTGVKPGEIKKDDMCLLYSSTRGNIYFRRNEDFVTDRLQNSKSAPKIIGLVVGRFRPC